MKKFFAVVLTILVLASILCICVFAAEPELINENGINRLGSIDRNVEYYGKRLGSIFGEGSLTNILAVVSIAASAVSVSLSVILYKKAISAAKNSKEKESEDKE